MMSNQDKKNAQVCKNTRKPQPAVVNGRLNIRANPKLFGRLVAGDEGAIVEIGLRAIQNEATFIGIPKGVSTQFLLKMQDAVKERGIKVDFVNFSLSDFWVEKAQQEIAWRERQERRQHSKGNKRTSGKDSHRPKSLALDSEGRDDEGRSRRKAHSNLSPEEKAERRRQQAAKKAERAAENKALRAKMKSTSGKAKE
jgi:hypothetical protein